MNGRSATMSRVRSRADNRLTRALRLTIRDIAVNSIAGSSLAFFPLRVTIYRLFGMTIQTLNIRSGCHFAAGSVSIGPRTFVNYRCFFDGDVRIGSDCEIAMDVLFCGTTHEVGPAHHRAGAVVSQPISIGDGCWIGARAMIMPGVSIGAGSIVGAGAIVTKDCPPNTVIRGEPARAARTLAER